jgi:hypothetical protein
MATESTMTSALLARWRKRHPKGIAWKFNDRVAHSRPDVQLINKGRVYFIEFKKQDGRLTPGQERELNLLAHAHGNTYVARFVGTMIALEEVVPADAPYYGYTPFPLLTPFGFCEFFS